MVEAATGAGAAPRRTKLLLPLLLLLPALLVLAACGGDADEDDAAGNPAATNTAVTSASSDETPATSEIPQATAPVGTSNEAAAAFAAVDVPFDLADGTLLGEESAKVTVTVYEDFQCPHCLNYTLNVEPMLIDEYVKTGKIRLEFQNFPILGQESVLAAIAGHCAAEQNLFWQYHKKLFLVQAEANQLTDEKVNIGRFSGDNLIAYALELGADDATFNACLTADTTVADLTAQVSAGQNLGFRGTPSFAINGVAQAGQPTSLAAWRTLLDAEIAKAQ